MNIDNKYISPPPPRVVADFFTTCMQCNIHLDEKRFKSAFCSERCYNEFVLEIQEMIKNLYEWSKQNFDTTCFTLPHDVIIPQKDGD